MFDYKNKYFNIYLKTQLDGQFTRGMNYFLLNITVFIILFWIHLLSTHILTSLIYLISISFKTFHLDLNTDYNIRIYKSFFQQS